MREDGHRICISETLYRTGFRGQQISEMQPAPLSTLTVESASTISLCYAHKVCAFGRQIKQHRFQSFEISNARYRREKTKRRAIAGIARIPGELLVAPLTPPTARSAHALKRCAGRTWRPGGCSVLCRDDRRTRSEAFRRSGARWLRALSPIKRQGTDFPAAGSLIE